MNKDNKSNSFPLEITVEPTMIGIQYHKLNPLDYIDEYILLENAIVYLIGDKSSFRMNKNSYSIQQFSVFYIGKGGTFSILPRDKVLEYYIILFSGLLSLPLEKDFGYIPMNPIYYIDLLRRMEEKWNMPSPINILFVKSAFYQLLYSLSEEYEKSNKTLLEPDIVLMSMQYMEEHLEENISFRTLSEYFHVSTSHLRKLFKERIGKSPQEFITLLRMEKIKYYLTTTSMTLKEIATALGFYDEYYLSKIFKKYEGIPPLAYKSKNTSNQSDLSISSESINSYNLIDYGNQYQTQEKGVYTMTKSFKSKAFMVGALSCMLLLNGCSKEVVEPKAEPTSTPQATQSEDKEATKVVSTVLGDVEIPVNPKRVATDQYMGYLLKLGIIPVGVRDMMLDEYSAKNAGVDLSKVQGLGSFPMDPELLIDLEPDLIISGGPSENAEDYKKIAATVHIPYWEGESTNDPLDKFKRISQIFGKEDVAEAWIKEFENKLAEGKKSIEGIVKEGETVSVIIVSDDAIYIQAEKGGNYGSPVIYDYLGLPATEKAKEETEGFSNISMEVIGDYTGDYIFVYYYSKDAMDNLFKSEIWNTLPAVKNDRIYVYGGMDEGSVDDEFVMEDPYSLEQQVDTIVSLLLEK